MGAFVIIVFMIMNLAAFIAKFTGNPAFDYALAFGVQKSRSAAIAFWVFHILWLSLFKFSLFFLSGGTFDLSGDGPILQGAKYWHTVDPVICAIYCCLMFYTKELHLSHHAPKYYTITGVSIVTGYFSLLVGFGFVAYLASRHRAHDAEQEGMHLMALAHGLTKFKRRKEKIKYDGYDIPLEDYSKDYKEELKKLKKEHNRDPSVYMRYSPMIEPNELGDKSAIDTMAINESIRRDKVKETPSILKGHHLIKKKNALVKTSKKGASKKPKQEPEPEPEPKRRKTMAERAEEDVRKAMIINAKYRMGKDDPAIIKGIDVIETDKKKKKSLKEKLLPSPSRRKEIPLDYKDDEDYED